MILNFSKKIMLLISIATAGLSVVEAKDFMNDTRARALMLASTIATPCAFAASWQGQVHPLVAVGVIGFQAATVYFAKQYADSAEQGARDWSRNFPITRSQRQERDYQGYVQKENVAVNTGRVAFAVGAITALEIAGLVYFAASQNPALFQWWAHKILG